MSKGYVIWVDTVHDEEAMGAYLEKAVPMVLAAGGTPIVFGPADEVIEGEWPGAQTVILEFPSVEAAREWYRSDEYQAVIGERLAASVGQAVIIGGYEMPSA